MDYRTELLKRRMMRYEEPVEAPRRRKRKPSTGTPLKPSPGVYDEGKAARVSAYPPVRKFNAARSLKYPKRLGY